MQSVKQDMDMPIDFKCIGKIDDVYPTLPDMLLENWYRTWIWENSEGVRIATWDEGNSWCHFICEGTEEAITDYASAQYKEKSPI